MSTLESVYSRVGIGCEVTLDAYFEYADPFIGNKETINWTRKGLAEALHYLSNKQFKNIIQAKVPSITNKELQELIKKKNNKSLIEVLDRTSEIVDKLERKDIVKITQNLDGISLANLVSSGSNFKVLNKGAEKVLLKVAEYSKNGTLNIIGNYLDFVLLLRKAENNEKILLSDILGVFPNSVSLFSFLGEWLIDNKIQEIYKLTFEVAPDWYIVKFWNKEFRGNNGNPDEPLYLYYTDEKEKTNPEVVPTSFILTKKIANDIFGFLPSVVNFDSKGQIQNNSKSIFFIPTKQVEIGN